MKIRKTKETQWNESQAGVISNARLLIAHKNLQAEKKKKIFVLTRPEGRIAVRSMISANRA